MSVCVCVYVYVCMCMCVRECESGVRAWSHGRGRFNPPSPPHLRVDAEEIASFEGLGALLLRGVVRGDALALVRIHLRHDLCGVRVCVCACVRVCVCACVRTITSPPQPQGEV